MSLPGVSVVLELLVSYDVRVNILCVKFVGIRIFSSIKAIQEKNDCCLLSLLSLQIAEMSS